MKKLLVFIVLFLFMVSSSFAFSLNDITGMAIGMNKIPKVNLDMPSENHVYPSAIIKVKWSYSDFEDDEQVAYWIEIATDYQYSNVAVDIGGTTSETSKNIKLREGEGDYFVRVKVKDRYGWSDWSNSRVFYIDLSIKACSDNTKYWQCSNNVPFYCDGGFLVEDCSICGCDINSICQPSGRCLELTCRDGTNYGGCSKEEPYYCQAGNMIEVCSLCGCPKGKSCQSDGSCSSTMVVTQVQPSTGIRPLSILERIALFFKSFFT